MNFIKQFYYATLKNPRNGWKKYRVLNHVLLVIKRSFLLSFVRYTVCIPKYYFLKKKKKNFYDGNLYYTR